MNPFSSKLLPKQWATFIEGALVISSLGTRYPSFHTRFSAQNGDMET